MKQLMILVLSLMSSNLYSQNFTNINIPPKLCDVSHYGTNGQSQQIQLNTAHIQKAIDDCAAAGGGTVFFPAGNYLSGPLVLKSNIRIHLQKGATLVASTVEESYRPNSSSAHTAAENSWLPFISIAQAVNVEISGEGAIDGQGAVWWERWRKNVRENPAKRSATDRPRLIYLRESRQVKIQGVSISNSPSFHLVMRDSEDVEISHTRIVSPAFSPNTDGIDPINSRNVRITNNFIDCNDDHVAIKADMTSKSSHQFATNNIYIAHNRLRGGRGISIGSETSGGVSDVLVEHNQFEDSMYGIRIKSPRGKGGVVQNISFRDTSMLNVMVPLVFSGYYQGSPHDAKVLSEKLKAGGFVVGDQIYPDESDAAQPNLPNKTPVFRNVKVENLKSQGNSKAAGFIVGVPESVISEFQFKNVSIAADKGILVRHAQIKLENFELKVERGEKLIKQTHSKVIEVVPINQN
jgi:hypothetical protein